MTSVSDMEIHLPLVVDLDGTLTLSDTLYESFAKLLFQNPVAALGCALHLARGPAAVKRYIAGHCRPDPPRSRDGPRRIRRLRTMSRAISACSRRQPAATDGSI